MKYMKAGRGSGLIAIFVCVVLILVISVGLLAQNDAKEKAKSEKMGPKKKMPQEEGAYQEDLLDKVLARDKATLSRSKPPSLSTPPATYETFGEKLRKEKAKERLKNMGKERNRQNNPLIKLIE